MIGIAAALVLASSGVGEPQQSGELLRYLVGTWQVVSIDPAGGDELRVCYSVQPFLGEKWISGVATSTSPGFASKDVWGYDGASGELVRTIFDASGTYAVVRSPGWKGDTLILNGDAKSTAGTIRVRETIRRRGENEFKATWEALRGGRWSAYAVETATRVLSGKCLFS
jgi:hypothetical protein